MVAHGPRTLKCISDVLEINFEHISDLLEINCERISDLLQISFTRVHSPASDADNLLKLHLSWKRNFIIFTKLASLGVSVVAKITTSGATIIGIESVISQ